MSTRTVYLFVGPPGAGKGSLSWQCVDQLGWKQVSTGDLCRSHIQGKTEIGKKIDFAIKSGKLVSDSLITDMVSDWLNVNAQDESSFILDGYPRTVGQAELFKKLLQDSFSDLRVVVIVLKVSDSQVITRLGSRVLCKNKGCQAVYSTRPESPYFPKQENLCDRCDSELIIRHDDLPEAVAERLKSYHHHEKALLDYFDYLKFNVITFDASCNPEVMFKRFKELVGNV